jgi:hypothetical protein
VFEEGVWVGSVGGRVGGGTEKGRIDNQVDVFAAIGRLGTIADQKRDGSGLNGRPHLAEFLGDGKFVTGDSIYREGK